MNRPSALFALLLFASGCAAPGDESPTPEPVGDPQGSWQLVEGRTSTGPIVLVEDHPITITLEGSTVGGQACNHYGGRIEPAAGGIAIREMQGTAMACAPEEAMVAEAAYMEALAAVRAIRLDGDALVLEGPGVELRFEALSEPPTA